MAVDHEVEAIKKFQSTVVSDALSYKLNVPYGGFLPDIVMYSPEFLSPKTKIVGRAFTIKYVPKTDKTSPYLSDFPIDHIPAGYISFVSQPPGVTCSTGGDVIANRGKQRGAIGNIVDGRFRDLQGYRDIGYPCFAKGQATTSYSSATRASAYGVPVDVKMPEPVLEGWPDHITVHPDDILIADIDGVVVIPKELASKVIELVPQYIEADAKSLHDIQHEGISLQEASYRYRGVPRPQ